jgi:hypothetical protein
MAAPHCLLTPDRALWFQIVALFACSALAAEHECHHHSG